MKLTEILELTKAGFKASEIREIMKNEKEAPAEPKEAIEEPKEPIEEPKEPIEEPKEPAEPSIDYEVKYREAMEALSKAQAENINRDVSDKIVDTEKVLSDAIRRFI